MEKIPVSLHFIFLYLLLVAISFQSFLLGPDVFGIYTGIYGIRISYPQNLIISVFLLGIITLFAYFCYLIFSNYIHQILAILMGIILGGTIFSITSESNLFIATLFDFTMFGLLVFKSYQIESETLQTEKSLRIDLIHVAIIIGLITIETLANYTLWRLNPPTGQDFSDWDFHSFIAQKRNFDVKKYFPFLDIESYQQDLLLGSSISFILRSLILIFYAFLVWQRTTTVMSYLTRFIKIYEVNSQPFDGKIQINYKLRSELPEKSYKTDDLMLIQEKYNQTCEALKNVSVQLFTSPSSGETKLGYNVFKSGIGQEYGEKLSKLLGINKIITQFNDEIKGLMIVYPSFNPLWFENCFIKTDNDILEPIWKYYNIIHYYPTKGKTTLNSEKVISHIGSSDINSRLFQNKLERFVRGTNHHLYNHNMSNTDLELGNVLKSSIDIAIFTLHANIDGDGMPYFYYNSNGEKLKIYPENLYSQLGDIEIKTALIIGCNTTTWQDQTDFIDVLMDHGAGMVLSFRSNVLSSHMPLISLPILVELTKANQLTIEIIHKALTNSYAVINQFGYSIQYSFASVFVQKIGYEL